MLGEIYCQDSEKGIWCPAYFNNPSLFSGWVSHLIHLKGSGLSLSHGLGWKHDLRIWMYWKSWNVGGDFGGKCTITINWTISYCCNLHLEPFIAGNTRSRVVWSLSCTVEISKCNHCSLLSCSLSFLVLIHPWHSPSNTWPSSIFLLSAFFF